MKRKKKFCFILSKFSARLDEETINFRYRWFFSILLLFSFFLLLNVVRSTDFMVIEKRPEQKSTGGSKIRFPTLSFDKKSRKKAYQKWVCSSLSSKQRFRYKQKVVESIYIQRERKRCWDGKKDVSIESVKTYKNYNFST